MGYFFLLPAADCAAFIKSLAKDLSVNEVVRPVIEDLFAFMPFAGNEDDVFSGRQRPLSADQHPVQPVRPA